MVRYLSLTIALVFILVPILSACLGTIDTDTTNNVQSQTSNEAQTQTITTTQQNLGDTTSVSDQLISDQVNRIIRITGLNTYPDLELTARVENGVVILEGYVMNYDEDNLLSSIKSIDGVVRIVCNYQYLAE